MTTTLRATVFTFPPIPPETQPGRCINDIDLGSGGVLLPPDYTYTDGVNCVGGCSVAINADKESNLYVANQAHLGGFNANTNCTNSFNNIQCVTTPYPTETAQGYWASPAYWHYKDSQRNDHYVLYYSATTDTQPTLPPLPINGYQLATSGSPISQTPTASTKTLFCQFSPTPSVSWNSTAKDPTTSILWAIEQSQNSDNQGGSTPDCNGNPIPHAALRAFNAASLAAPELYSSRRVIKNIGKVNAFPVPTVFKGQVYMGTQTEVDVFGLCSTNGSSGCLQ